MTQVDFYILSESSPGDRLQLACRIAEKAFNTGHRVVIHTDSADQAKRLDLLLWSFREQSFLPHGLLATADPTIDQILIGDARKAEQEHDVLLNLALEVPTFFSRFTRLAECVDNDPTARNASRERYRFYRDRGYPLAVHKVS